MSVPSVQKLLQRAMPMHSHRRLIGRTIKQVLADPASFRDRINGTNLGNFWRFRTRAFTCSVCGARTTPLYDFPDLRLRRKHLTRATRETLQCRVCYASMRQRALAFALLEDVGRRTGTRHATVADLAKAGLGGIRILDTDNFSAISQHLRDDPSYVRCSYLPDRPWGTEIEPGYFNIDLEHINFPDESFDIVMTSDVMEHVRDSEAAHREIARVLRPGGSYVFTVPYADDQQEDIVLVDTSTDADVFLCEPHYHGDPLSGGILAYRIFGRSLLDRLRDLGLEARFRQLNEPGNLIVDGDVFTATKPAASG